MESFQMGKRADKLLERAAIKIKKNLKDAHKEIGGILIEAYGDLYSAFEEIKAGNIAEKIPQNWLAVLKEIAEAEIKEKVIVARAELTLQSSESDGLDRIKGVLMKIQKLSTEIEIRYIGAPKYYVDFTLKEFKEMDRLLSKMDRILESEKGIEYSVLRKKG
jgi:translation initiation factor 2 alpha subunit (eIF-2alpha)